MPTFAIHRICAVITIMGVVSLVGCGGTSTVSISGKVSVDDQPLQLGSVTFHADGSKGNTSTEIPSAEIDSTGNYTLEATPGAYKVTVFAEKPRPEDGEEAYAEPEYLVAQSFNMVESTPLAVEVKAAAAAGAYDLKVSSK